MELLRPILELGVVIPGMLLAYFPAKSSLKQPLSTLVLWLVPLLALLCAAGGVVCYARRMPTAPVLAGLTLLAVVIYIKTLRISLWKSGTIALSVCAVFACINSLSRAINAAMLAGLPQAQAAPWFCLRSAICYHAICWLFAAIAYYPATHSVRRMVEDENFAQTWYVFWVLPLVFIALNLFMIPKYADTLYTGRVLQGYFVISIALLFLMLFFNAIFLLMAISINRNVRLQQENQLLSMQQQRYENCAGISLSRLSSMSAPLPSWILITASYSLSLLPTKPPAPFRRRSCPAHSHCLAAPFPACFLQVLSSRRQSARPACRAQDTA